MNRTKVTLIHEENPNKRRLMTPELDERVEVVSKRLLVNHKTKTRLQQHSSDPSGGWWFEVKAGVALFCCRCEFRWIVLFIVYSFVVITAFNQRTVRSSPKYTRFLTCLVWVTLNDVLKVLLCVLLCSAIKVLMTLGKRGIYATTRSSARAIISKIQMWTL